MSQSIPQQLAKYKILDILGQGGFSTVYKAEDTTLGRIVALKVLDPLLLRDPTFIERFRLEARAVANLYHPHIVALHEMGESEGTFYLAMQYVDGPPLNERLTGEPLPLAETAAIVGDIASALDYAHEQGLVHRDVKPSNILLDRKGRAYLSDFGIVKALEATRVMTSQGAIIGTPEYMSPEQAQSLDLDGRSDAYSLGVVAYQMCTGRVPFTGSTPTSVHYKHVHEPPPPPSSLHPQASGPVEAVLLKALAKQPDDRYAAGDFAQALAEAVTEVESGWLREQVAGAGAWIEGGRYREAIERLEPLAQAHPDDEEIADLLTRARERAHLAGLYDEVQRLWADAEATAAEIVAADPDYDDPQGVLARLREPEPIPRPKAAPAKPTQPRPAETEEAGEWPGWISKAALAAVIVGSVGRMALRLLYAVQEGESYGGGGLVLFGVFILLAVLSARKRLPHRTRQGLATVNLFLILFSTLWMSDILRWAHDLPSGMMLGWSILELVVLLGIAVIYWTLAAKRRDGLTGISIALGGLFIVLSFFSEWVYFRYRDNGDLRTWYDWGWELVFWTRYPFWLGSAVVLLPTMSLLSSALLRPDPDDPDPAHRKKRATWSVILTGAALLGMVAVGLPTFYLSYPEKTISIFETASLGVWLMLAGLALVFAGTLIRARPFLRASKKT